MVATFNTKLLVRKGSGSRVPDQLRGAPLVPPLQTTRQEQEMGVWIFLGTPQILVVLLVSFKTTKKGYPQEKTSHPNGELKQDTQQLTSGNWVPPTNREPPPN